GERMQRVVLVHRQLLRVAVYRGGRGEHQPAHAFGGGRGEDVVVADHVDVHRLVGVGDRFVDRYRGEVDHRLAALDRALHAAAVPDVLVDQLDVAAGHQRGHLVPVAAEHVVHDPDPVVALE